MRKILLGSKGSSPVTLKLYRLNKIVLRIKNNPAKFLNGITANTLEAPHSAFVDFHGKVIATFDQIAVGADEQLIVIEQQLLDLLMQHLERYIKLSKAVVEKADYHVYFDLGGSYKREEGEYVIPQKKGQLILTKKDLPVVISEEEFTLFRLQNNIPLQGADYKDDFLLNVSETEHVSFTKGCFLGQEFLSKVHNRSKPSWKLVVKAEDEASEEERVKMTSRARDPKTGKTLGFVFVSTLKKS